MGAKALVLFPLGVIAVAFLVFGMLPLGAMMSGAVSEVVYLAESASAPAQPRIEVPDYSSIPLTNHALTSHQGEQWNASSIRDHFTQGNCTPYIRVCSAEDIEIHSCYEPEKEGMTIALVIGHTVKQVITGYMARDSYWENKCQP